MDDRSPKGETSWIARSRRFFGEFTAGLDRKEVRRLFDEEATQAFRTLAGRRGDEELPTKSFERLMVEIRDVFLGFVFKLSPGRRLLFTVSLICPILGLFDLDIRLSGGSFFVDSSPFWFIMSISGLTLLLALEMVDRIRVRDELEVARALQRDLLPQDLPPMPGFGVAHSYRTANEIGGDYYGFMPIADGRIAIAIGDASGHGMAAGLLMAIANATLEATIDVDAQPQSVIEAVNRTLFRTGTNRAFLTLFYGLLDLQTGELEFANAGHCFPLLRREDGRVEEIGQGSLPLGLRATGEWPTQTAALEPGDLLVLYSDGIPEAVANGQDFGFERLRGLLRTPGSARTVHDRVLDNLDRHLGDEPLRDDLTLVVIDRLPPLPPVHS